MVRRSQPNQIDLRQRILNASLNEFAEKGYHQATLDEIASRVGASKGSVYWYFENKRALFLDVVTEELSRLTKYLEAVVTDGNQSAVARIKAFIVANLTYYTDHPEFCSLIKVFNSPGGPGLDKDMEIIVAEDYHRLRAMADSLLQEGVRRGELDPACTAVAAPMMIALLDGLMFQWVLDPQAVPLKELAGTVAGAFLEGIIKRTN